MIYVADLRGQYSREGGLGDIRAMTLRRQAWREDRGLGDIRAMTLSRQAWRENRGLGAVESAWWPTTGDIDTETNSLELEVRQLGQDIFNSSPNTGTSDAYFQLQNAWNTFVQDFDQWKDAGWFWNLTRRDQLLSYRSRFNDLLTQWKAMGVGTAAQPQADTPSDPFGKLLGTLTTVVIVAGVGVGAYYGVKIWRASKGGA